VQSQTCLSSAERAGLRPKGNVPTLRFPEFKDEWDKDRVRNLFTMNVGGDIDKANVSSIQTDVFKYPVIANALSNDGIYGYTSEYKDDCPSITVTGRGDVGLAKYRDYPLFPIVRLLVLHSKGKIDCRFGVHAINCIKKYEESTGVPQLTAPQLGAYSISFPNLTEQAKIGAFLKLIDERISTQIRIIEDLKQLRLALIELLYSQSQPNYKIGDMIVQVSNRNRNEKKYPVLSVNNQLGFIEQSEQFEDRMVASDDTSNYKVVNYNDFAYNPARINVGSIARLTSFENGIVSPMYVCFHTKRQLLPEYLECFFDTQYFYNEIQKRLEGSVRLCLSWEGICNIPITIPTIERQKDVSKQISILFDKISIEERYLKMLRSQKKYILSQMFI